LDSNWSLLLVIIAIPRDEGSPPRNFDDNNGRHHRVGHAGRNLKPMGKIILVFLGFALFGAAHSAHAECIVADPSPTPLNVRTPPYGRIVGALDNGQLVSILDSSIDNQGRPWVYVADDTGNPLGWV
jgi:hypothetical protein